MHRCRIVALTRLFVPKFCCPPAGHELYHSPVATSCAHTFCAFCLGRVFEVRRAADPPGAPPAERERDCPMCR